MRKVLFIPFLILLTFLTGTVSAEQYIIDTKGAHAFVQFRIKHLGYSWLYGRFNKFSGDFKIDRDNPSKSKILVTIDTNSIDTSHAERDKHLRSKDFLAVDKYPKATFISKEIKLNNDRKGGQIIGDLTLKGITKSLVIDFMIVGEGKDPWGGYRLGFEGSSKISLKEFGINYNLGDASKEVEIILSIEGIRQ